MEFNEIFNGRRKNKIEVGAYVLLTRSPGAPVAIYQRNYALPLFYYLARTKIRYLPPYLLLASQIICFVKSESRTFRVSGHGGDNDGQPRAYCSSELLFQAAGC